MRTIDDMGRHIPVIAFHGIADTPQDKWTIETKHFEAFLRFLKRKGFRTISCADVIRLRDDYQPKKIALTFDDGYASVYAIAYPLLKRYGFTATVFMTTNFIDSVVTSGGMALPALTKAHLRELATAGWEIGSHACRHTDLRKLTSEEQKFELQESKKILEAITQKPVATMSYPHGRYDDQLQKLLPATSYAGGLSIFTGKKNSSYSAFAYDRLELSPQEHIFQDLLFLFKTNGFYVP